jgi:hypothetical protein
MSNYPNIRKIPKITLRPRESPREDNQISGLVQSRVTNNFQTYPDFSTVTLPLGSSPKSRRLGLINVDPAHPVPNSIDPSNAAESGAYGDDLVESLSQCQWYPNVVRIGTIGDGSCFFHAVLKAGSPEYQNNNSYRARTTQVFMLRRDLAYLLTLPNPRYPTEEAARVMLWKAYNLDSDESLITYLSNVKMMSFTEPPRMPRIPRSESNDLNAQWNQYESDRKNWAQYNYPRARQYATNHDIVDCRSFLGDATRTLPLNSYYFTLREGKLPELAIMRKMLSLDQDIDVTDFIDLRELVSILINPSRYVGDTDVVGWFAEVANVDIYFCHVYNDKVIPSRIIRAETSSVAIMINNSGGDYGNPEGSHFETMGVKISVPSPRSNFSLHEKGSVDQIQTIFPPEHPFLKAFQAQMQNANSGASPSNGLAH